MLTGAVDPFVPAEQVEAFTQEMKAAADAKFQVVTFLNAKHGFTNPNAGKAGLDALEYNAEADKKSWVAMLGFFKEVFPPLSLTMSVRVRWVMAVTLINVFAVPKDKEDEFVSWWTKVKADITKQPASSAASFTKALRRRAGTTLSTSPCGRTKRSIGKPMKKASDR